VRPDVRLVEEEIAFAVDGGERLRQGTWHRVGRIEGRGAGAEDAGVQASEEKGDPLPCGVTW
jgi:hypothetical protein